MAIAGCATTLRRWDKLVFTGGVGENSAAMRGKIAARLLALRGLDRDHVTSPEAQLTAAGLEISTVPADEEATIDRLTRALLWSSDS